MGKNIKKENYNLKVNIKIQKEMEKVDDTEIMN